MPTMMEYAKKEMALAGYSGDNKRRLQLCIYQLIQTFESQGHRNFETSFIVDIFQKLAQFQPISPLLGTDEEWIAYDKNTLQNVRCHTVFKKIDTGRAYDTNVYVARDAEGRCYSTEVEYPVTFPYMPHTEYVKATTRTVIHPPTPADLTEGG